MELKDMTEWQLDAERMRGEALHQEGKAIKKAVQDERDRRSRISGVMGEVSQILNATGIESEENIGNLGG